MPARGAQRMSVSIRTTRDTLAPVRAIDIDVENQTLPADEQKLTARIRAGKERPELDAGAANRGARRRSEFGHPSHILAARQRGREIPRTRLEERLFDLRRGPAHVAKHGHALGCEKVRIRRGREADVTTTWSSTWLQFLPPLEVVQQLRVAVHRQPRRVARAAMVGAVPHLLRHEDDVALHGVEDRQVADLVVDRPFEDEPELG